MQYCIIQSCTPSTQFVAADNPVQVDALSALDPQNIWGQTDTQLQTMNAFVCLCNQLNDSTPDNTPLASELRVLNLVGDIYFNTLQSVFPIGAVNKCHTAFTLLMQDLGVKYSSDAIGNYLRRRRTMYNEIVNWSRNGGSASTGDILHAMNSMQGKLESMQNHVEQLDTAVTTNTKTIANFDRRQKAFLEHLKKIFAAFIKLFRPAPKPPTREQVAAGLSLKDHYACLEKVNEPHRSQLKAVIDYTYKHPIVREAKHRSGFTLADAARAVWNKNNLKWGLVPDAYSTFEQLKSACYNIREKHSDAFYYQKRR